MAEQTSRVTDAATGILVREVSTPASSGIQQVVSFADGVSGVLAQIRSTGSLDVNIAQSTGNIAITSGSITGSGVSVAANTINAGNVGIQLAGGTYTNLPVAFEATIDGTNWFGITAVRTDRSTINSTATMASQGTYYWNVECTAYIQVRVRQTAAASTQTANPQVVIAQGPLLYDPSPVVTEAQPDTSTMTQVASTTTVTQALAPNPRRRAAFLYNESTQACYVCLGAAGNTTFYTVQIPSYGFYEIPYPAYIGTVWVFWTTVNGSVKITELYS